MIGLGRGVVVRVVAETLANGAPHPHHGRAGVVLELRDAGPHPVRVQVAGRAVWFAVDELTTDVGDVDDADATRSSG